jgi:hypothetical protein
MASTCGPADGDNGQQRGIGLTRALRCCARFKGGHSTCFSRIPRAPTAMTSFLLKRLAPPLRTLAALAAFVLACPVGAQVLPNDFLIHATPYFENTAKAVPPGTACPLGSIAMATGQPRDTAQLLSRPLFGPDGQVDTTSVATGVPYPTGPTRAIATDNQIVRLKDGSLLAAKDAFVWDDISPDPPPWFGETVTGSGDHKGQRGGVLLFRSTDCGVTWTAYSAIDFANILEGKYGFPQPMGDTNGDGVDEINVPFDKQGKRADGSLKWWVGGQDRTEIYACPFTGLLYLTTRVGSGPYKKETDPNPLVPHRDTAMLLYSKDNGISWELVKEDFPSWSPLVMTSTPNGRLFVFQLVGSEPTVYFSRAAVTAGQKPEMSPGYVVHYTDGATVIPNAGANPADVDLFLQLYHPSISRVSADPTSSKVRASYHTVNAQGMQESPIITIDVQDPNTSPVVKPVKIVRAQDPANYSVLYFNFIDPDYIDLPLAMPSNTSVGYWIEVPRKGLVDEKFAVRHSIFEGDINTSCPANLSLQNGQPRSWATSQPLGDYMSGGFYWKDQRLNYLAQWVEPAGIKANIVSLPYQAPGGVPDMTVTAVWEAGAQDETQVYDWRYEDYRKKYDELWPLGWRLHALENRVVGNEVRYTAVWRQGAVPEVQVYEKTYEDFRRTYDELWPQGWRLHLLSNPVVGGQVRYTAVWRQDAVPEIQLYEQSYADFRSRYDALWPFGWRLHLLSNPVVDGQVRYTAVLRRESVDEIQVYEQAYAAYRQKYDELWPLGWRLHLLENPVVGGQVRYTAVWRPGTSGETQVYDWSYADFRRHYDELFCDGWRLKLLNVR